MAEKVKALGLERDLNGESSDAEMVVNHAVDGDNRYLYFIDKSLSERPSGSKRAA